MGFQLNSLEFQLDIIKIFSEYIEFQLILAGIYLELVEF